MGIADGMWLVVAIIIRTESPAIQVLYLACPKVPARNLGLRAFCLGHGLGFRV